MTKYVLSQKKKPRQPKCKACLGTGKSSKGRDCIPCKGTGYFQQQKG